MKSNCILQLRIFQLHVLTACTILSPCFFSAERKSRAEIFRLEKEQAKKSAASNNTTKDNLKSNKSEKHNTNDNRLSSKSSTVRNMVKPRILKRPNSREEKRGEKHLKISPKDKRDSKLSRTGRDSSRKTSIRSVKHNESRKPSVKKNTTKNVDDFDISLDLNDDIDLDIGVEVEDHPDLKLQEDNDILKDSTPLSVIIAILFQALFYS